MIDSNYFFKKNVLKKKLKKGGSKVMINYLVDDSDPDETATSVRISIHLRTFSMSSLKSLPEN
jgi:hypothetical protein